MPFFEPAKTVYAAIGLEKRHRINGLPKPNRKENTADKRIGIAKRKVSWMCEEKKTKEVIKELMDDTARRKLAAREMNRKRMEARPKK